MFEDSRYTNLRAVKIVRLKKPRTDTQSAIMTMALQMKEELLAENGEVIGEFVACFCETCSDLFGADHFSNDNFSVLTDLNYPLVYLRSVKVHSSDNRRKGHGGRLLNLLRERAIEIGAISAFARIGDPETSDEYLWSFYSKNGWKLINEGGTHGPKFASWNFDLV